MKPTIEEAAENLAKAITPEIENMVYDSDECEIEEYIKDKATQFAKEMLSHQWRSVDGEKPPIGVNFLGTNVAWGADDVILCFYNGKDVFDLPDGDYCQISHWMEIPPLNPDFAPEKQTTDKKQ